MLNLTNNEKLSLHFTPTEVRILIGALLSTKDSNEFGASEEHEAIDVILTKIADQTGETEA